MNFALAAHARVFQIRGVGEESQFIDPVNPSVGLMIDGIDMTGLGTAAALLMWRKWKSCAAHKARALVPMPWAV